MIRAWHRATKQRYSPLSVVVLAGVLAVMLLQAFAVTLHAQSTAMLRGRVVDATGGVIAGAEVIASDVAAARLEF